MAGGQLSIPKFSINYNVQEIHETHHVRFNQAQPSKAIGM